MSLIADQMLGIGKMLLLICRPKNKEEAEEKKGTKKFRRRAEREGKMRPVVDDEVDYDTTPEEGVEMVTIDPDLDIYVAAQVLWSHLSKYLKAKDNMELSEWFKEIDTDGSKKLEADELFAAFLRIGVLGASLDMVGEVIYLADPEGDGKMSYRAMVEALGRFGTAGNTTRLERRVRWHKNPALRHSMSVAEAHHDKMAMIDFLESIGLDHYTEHFLDFGLDSMGDLSDEDLVDDDTLAQTLGLSPQEIQRFHEGLAKAAAQLERYKAHQAALSVNRFGLYEFLEPLGLQDKADTFFEHGIESVQDALDEELTGDEILIDLGLSLEQIEAYHEHAATKREDDTDRLELFEFLGVVDLQDKVGVFMKLGLNTAECATSEVLAHDRLLEEEVALATEEIEAYRLKAASFREARGYSI